MEPTSEFPVTDEDAEIPSTFRQATKTIFSSTTTIALSVNRSLEDPIIESGFSSLRDDLSEKVCLLMIEGCCQFPICLVTQAQLSIHM